MVHGIESKIITALRTRLKREIMKPIILLPLLLLTFTVIAQSADIYVPDDQPTIQDAINASAAGDTVIVRAGTYVENIDFLGKDITVLSEEGNERAFIDGSQGGSVVTFSGGETAAAVLDGFTVMNGSSVDGGGIFCSGTSSPTIRNNYVEENTATSGGGGLACLSGSSPTVDSNTFDGNEADLGGGIHCGSDTAVFTNNLVVKNRSTSAGGGFHLSGSSPAVTNNTVAGNISDGTGGGIECAGFSGLVVNTIVWGNQSGGTGQQINIASGSPIVEYCCVEGGWSGAGNISDDPEFFTMEYDEFHLPWGSPCIDAGTNATGLSHDMDGQIRPIDGSQGGSPVTDIGCHELNPIYVPDMHVTIKDAVDAAYHRDTVVVFPDTYNITMFTKIELGNKTLTVQSASGNPEDTVIHGYGEKRGFSMSNYSAGLSQIRPGSVITGFTITNHGSSIFTEYRSPTIINNVITNNHTGIESLWYGQCVILDNLISNNYGGGGIKANGDERVIARNVIHSNNTKQYGGGIRSDGSVVPKLIANNVVYNNTATLGGGGIWIHWAHNGVILVNNIIFGNKAPIGAGIWLDECAATVTGNTISGNHADDGGGIYVDGGNLNIYLENSIVWGNRARQNQGIFTTEPHKLTVSHCVVQGGWAGVGNLDQDPLILSVDGTELRVPWGSPCIDAGDDLATGISELDFDGKPRILDGDGDGTAHADIGAYELSPVYVPGDYPTIQAAIDAASVHDTVVVDPGTYTEYLDIYKGVIVQGRDGHGNTTLDGLSAGCPVHFSLTGEEPGILTGFTVTNGSGYSSGLDTLGGAVYCASDSRSIVADCVLTGNSAKRGGALFSGLGAETVVNQCDISGNSGLIRAGAIEIDSSNH